MNTNKGHITKKFIVFVFLFVIGLMTSIVSAVTTDTSTVDTRAVTILESIKSNAKQLSPNDVSAYYTLVRMNIKSLMEVLTIVDAKLAAELVATPSPVNPPVTPTYIDFQANNCTIPAGKSLCMATLYIGAPTGKIYTVKNTSRGITSANIITPNNYSSQTSKYVLTTTFSGDDAANMIKYGENQLELVENDTRVARAVNTAECAPSTKWNGQICDNSVVTPPKPTISLNRSPKVLKPGQSMMMSWNTTNATEFSYYCTGTGVQANKKVSIELNASPYSNTWENLTKIGWSGTYNCNFVAVGAGGTTILQDSFTIDNSTQENPGEDTAKLTFTCSKSVYSVGETVSCKISGGFGAPNSKYCYQSGTSGADRALCTTYGWTVSGNDLIYSKIVETQMIGDYTVFAEDSKGNKTSTVIVYKATPTSTYIDFQANNCTIPAGKSLCMSTLYIGAPTGKIYTVKNTSRGITSANIITPNNYSATMNKYVLTTTFSGDDAANMVKYGENQLLLLEGDKQITRAVNTAECAPSTKWNGQICESTVVTTPPVTPTYIDFQANNCTIPEGKSNCMATLYIGAPTGKVYTVKNITRSITSANIITPNNYSNTDKKYILTGSISGNDAANFIKFGENTISLLEGDKQVGIAINTAECAIGLTWNGLSCVVAMTATPAEGVFNISNKNTLTTQITGITKENTLICNEITAHPTFPSSINTGFCNNPSNFIPFTGNNAWTYKTNKWIGMIPYDSSIYGNAGIKTRTFWKDKITGVIVTYDISVVSGF